MISFLRLCFQKTYECCTDVKEASKSTIAEIINQPTIVVSVIRPLTSNDQELPPKISNFYNVSCWFYFSNWSFRPTSQRSTLTLLWPLHICMRVLLYHFNITWLIIRNNYIVLSDTSPWLSCSILSFRTTCWRSQIESVKYTLSILKYIKVVPFLKPVSLIVP